MASAAGPGPATLVAREGELERLATFLRDPVAEPSVLVLEGEAGIGKTTLWEAGIAIARAEAVPVLSCQPAEGETALPFSGLADLLEPVRDRAQTLPAPLALALDVALLRAEAAEDGVDRHAVGRAVLELLRATSATPALVAIDDVQWLDAPTAAAIAFALRRLAGLPVRVLVARRSDRDAPLPLGLERAPAGLHAVRLRLGSLSVGGVDALLRARLGLELPRTRLVALHEACGGNAFYALEIGRALASRAPDDRVDGMPIPDSLAGLLRERLERLSPAGRDAALLVAAAPGIPVRIVGAAAGGSAGPGEAVKAGILGVRGDRMRFTHPLLASVTYEAALPWERRDAHRRLAEHLGTLERALHLALATDEQSDAVAGEVEEGGRIAAGRGAAEAAAKLYEHAARLTPPESEQDARRRLVESAEHYVAAGDQRRGRSILEGLVESMSPGPERAAALWRLADAVEDDLATSIRLCEQALAEATREPALLSEIHTALGVFRWLVGDLTGAAEHTHRAAEEAEEAGDDRLLAIALAEAAHADVVLGRPLPEVAMERALALEAAAGPFPTSLRPSFQLGVMRMYRDELDAARPLLAAELERATGRGDEAARATVLVRLVELEWRAGNWADAWRLAREAAQLGRQAIGDQGQSVAIVLYALVAAHIGEMDEARSTAGQALATAHTGGDGVVEARARGVLGFLELSLGDPAAAHGWLEPAADALVAMGAGELSIHGVVENEIEALAALGDLDRAAALADLVEERGRASARLWHRGVASRGRALVAGARGDLEAARAHADAALDAGMRLGRPFELGRTLLAKGTVERRGKQWGAARRSLGRALELFDELGAPLWAEKSAAELGRIPGRRKSAGGLSQTERRVAELVAEGLSNKEIAAALFLAVRTVEANVSRVYAKLGVQSRAELARHLTDERR
jgi:DNA-binding CsgD family transcriptional regulator